MLPIVAALLGVALAGKAVGAIYGPDATGLKRNLGLLPALGADYRVHLAPGAVCRRRAAGISRFAPSSHVRSAHHSTRLATLGIIAEPSFRVVLLFP